MTLRYELDPNQYSIRVYDSARGDMDYVSSGMVQVHGDVGWVMQISNPTFLDCLVENAEEIMSKIGVNQLEGALNPAMSRLMRIKSKGRAKYEEVKTIVSSGRELILGALEMNPFGSEAGATKHPNLRQKEHDMGKTFKLDCELLGEKGEVQFASKMVWNDCDDKDILYIEKHLLTGIIGMNTEAAAILAK